MLRSGSGAADLGTVFTFPISGVYSVEAELTVGACTGTGKLSLEVSGLGGLVEANNATDRDGSVNYRAAGSTLDLEIVKPGTISNDPDWSFELRVRLVGGPDLTQEL